MYTQEVIYFTLVKFGCTPDLRHTIDYRIHPVKRDLDDERMFMHGRPEVIDHRQVRLPVNTRNTKEKVELQRGRIMQVPGKRLPVCRQYGKGKPLPALVENNTSGPFFNRMCEAYIVHGESFLASPPAGGG